jgi:hypothetical protein
LPLIVRLLAFIGALVLTNPFRLFAHASSDQQFKIYAAESRDSTQLSRVVLTSDDVESYDWVHQTLFLKPSAVKKLKGEGRFNFVATLAEIRLFSGEAGGMTMALSATSLRYPILYLGTSQRRPVLVLRATHDFTSGFAKPKLGSEEWSTIASPKVKAHFEKLGKLKEQPNLDLKDFIPEGLSRTP